MTSFFLRFVLLSLDVENKHLSLVTLGERERCKDAEDEYASIRIAKKTQGICSSHCTIPYLFYPSSSSFVLSPSFLGQDVYREMGREKEKEDEEAAASSCSHYYCCDNNNKSRKKKKSKKKERKKEEYEYFD